MKRKTFIMITAIIRFLNYKQAEQYIKLKESLS